MQFKYVPYLDEDEPAPDFVCSKCGLIGGCPCCLGF
ncbi:hypothetical protein BRC2024_EJDNWAKA_CDS_0033 [Acinetobacter phage vB_AbaP_Fanak]